MGRLILPLLLAASALACGDDEPTPGFSGECANAGGTVLGCDPEPIETSQDACWRLVECGAIPLDDPREFWRPDWQRCVELIDDMTNEQRSIALMCVGASSCDDLKIESETGVSLCVDFGES